jgi:hypothetical protein
MAAVSHPGVTAQLTLGQAPEAIAAAPVGGHSGLRAGGIRR